MHVDKGHVNYSGAGAAAQFPRSLTQIVLHDLDATLWVKLCTIWTLRLLQTTGLSGAECNVNARRQGGQGDTL